MTDNELLLAISEIVEEKIRAEVEPLKSDIQQIKNEQTRINIIIENEIRSDIQLLAENYIPAAKRYEKATAQIEAIQADMEVMKSIIREHSQKLQNI